MRPYFFNIAFVSKGSSYCLGLGFWDSFLKLAEGLSYLGSGYLEFSGECLVFSYPGILVYLRALFFMFV